MKGVNVDVLASQAEDDDGDVNQELERLAKADQAAYIKEAEKGVSWQKTVHTLQE